MTREVTGLPQTTREVTGLPQTTSEEEKRVKTGECERGSAAAASLAVHPAATAHPKPLTASLNNTIGLYEFQKWSFVNIKLPTSWVVAAAARNAPTHHLAISLTNEERRQGTSSVLGLTSSFLTHMFRLSPSSC